MKKVLFPILALVLALGLALPMAAPVGAATETITIEPSWQKTTNYSLDSTLGATPYPCNDVYWTYTSTVWDGPATNGYGASIPGYVADLWAYWPHGGAIKTQFTHAWFKTTIDIDSASLLTGVKLVSKYKGGNLTINDDLYVYVNGTLAASGGTAPLVSGMPPVPAGFVTASGKDFSIATETDGWYIAGGLNIPVTAFTSGTNTICILVEDFWDWGGVGHLQFEVTREVPDIEKVLTDSEPDLTPDTNSNLIDEVALGTLYTFTMDITVTNSTGVDLTNVLVHDRLGGELRLDSTLPDYTDPTSGVTAWTRGKTEKWFIDWTIASLPDGESATLTIIASLDQNPGQGKPKRGETHQEYTSLGIYDLNSGATIVSAYIGEVFVEFEDIQTDPIRVEAMGTEED